MNISNPELLTLLILAVYPFYLAVKNQGYGRKITSLRTTSIILLAIAASSPTITQIDTIQEKQDINVLVDNTTSMKTVEKPNLPFENSEKVFIQGNNSDIFSQASQNIEENSQNLLITDSQTKQSTKPLIQKANKLNTSVSVMRLKEKSEAAVNIQGPSNTVPEAQNNFTINIKTKGENEVPLTVKLDGETVFQGTVEDQYSFVESFNTQGEHVIEAKINLTDIFQQNNKFYKTVEVNEKPKILSIGAQGSLENELSQFYSIESTQDVPEDLDEYYSIILKKPVENPRLESYLAQGNGLMYTGSLENQIPDFLPLTQSSDSEGDAGAKVVLVIDASFGTGKCEVEDGDEFCTEVSSEGGSAKESIQIAYSLVDALSENNKLGVTAYNRNSYLISEPKPLANSKEKVKQTISRIQPDGPSFHDRGLKGGVELVDKNDTIVMITDGKIGDYERRRNVPSKLETTSSNMEAKLITVGVGSETNQPLLKDIAENTGGYYIQNTETGRLKFEFGAGGGENEYKAIGITGPNHFITEDLKLEGSTTNFDSVETRDLGKTLVSGSNGEPVLSTWRFGLGRVAAFSAGNQNLERISKSDPELITRTTSWTVGNPQRKQENWKTVEDTRRPENPVAEASYNIPGLTKQTENLYTAELEKPGLGLHKWRNQTYAYNYNKEKAEPGQNMEKLKQIPRKTGGTIYNQQNIEQITQNTSKVEKQVEKQFSLSPYILGLALLILLGEIGYRKRNGRL